MYGGRALKRPDEFRDAVEAMKRAAEARQRVSAEYNAALIMQL